ncbi:hypothetical protein Ancab_023408 [Ancistrocladus abbreviatus]
MLKSIRAEESVKKNLKTVNCILIPSLGGIFISHVDSSLLMPIGKKVVSLLPGSGPSWPPLWSWEFVRDFQGVGWFCLTRFAIIRKCAMVVDGLRLRHFGLGLSLNLGSCFELV